MFSDVTSECVGFSTKWSSPKQSTETSSQTSDIQKEEKGCLSFSRKLSGIQTEEVVQSFNDISFDDKKLESFLNKVTPSLMKELDKVERSKAFSTYLNTDEDPPKPVKLLYTLYSKKDLPPLENVKVSCLSWSCTGNVVAVGFQAPYHSYWCTHRSCVQLYNINMHGFDGTTPSRTIQTESCVTKLAMHPYEPSILALGTHDGSVEVWYLEGSPTLVTRHSDCVTQLAWLYLDTQLLLASSGLDGLIHIFKLSTTIASVSKIDSYVVTEERNVIQPGVTCFAFAPKRPGVFVAALEGGSILQCSMSSAVIKAPDYQGVKNVKDPVVRPLARQTGPVSAVEFSPYIDDMFAVATVENKFTLYSLNENGAISVIWSDFEVIGLCWSMTNAHALYAWGNAGHISLFDSQTAREVAPLQPPDEPQPDSKLFIPSASVNQKSPTLIGFGTSTGEAHILQLPPHHI